MACCLGRFTALALTAVMWTGCSSGNEPSNGDDPPNGGEPSSLVTIVLTVYRAEWEADKILMAVGDYATVQIELMTSVGCQAAVPCPIVTDLTLRSSNPAVATLEEKLRLGGPRRADLIAHSPGTATVTVTADGRTESRQVTVVTIPPPPDSFHVEVVTEWKDLPARYDASHNLTWVEITGDFSPFRVRAFRSGKEIFGTPTYVSPTISNPPVTEATVGCRPTRSDIHCEVIHDFWVRAINSGEAQLTVWGRNACSPTDPNPCPYPSTTFTAHVPEQAFPRQ